MTLIQLFILSFIQGITEFLPVSSSAHLILVPYFCDWPDQGLAMDVAVHVGTLGAVLLYFWRDILLLAEGFFRLLTGEKTLYGRLSFVLIVGTIPAVLAGYALSLWGMDHVRSPLLIAGTSIGYGLALYLGDRYGQTKRDMTSITLKDGVVLGCAQALALIPGTSRSGVVMTFGRLLGLDRVSAARFAFLLSVPVIVGAGARTAYQLKTGGTDMIVWTNLGVAACLSFLFGLGAIHFMMLYIRRWSFAPFAIYRLILGLCILGVLYGGRLWGLSL